MSEPNGSKKRRLLSRLLRGLLGGLLAQPLEIAGLLADQLGESFQRCFSFETVDAEHAKQYARVATCLITIVCSFGCLTLVVGHYIAHPKDVDTVLPAMGQHVGLLVFLVLLFLFSCVRLYASGLNYFWGTLLTFIGFTTVAVAAALLVVCTGGMGSSIFGATLISMFGAALVVHKEKAARLLL